MEATAKSSISPLDTVSQSNVLPNSVINIVDDLAPTDGPMRFSIVQDFDHVRVQVDKAYQFVCMWVCLRDP